MNTQFLNEFRSKALAYIGKKCEACNGHKQIQDYFSESYELCVNCGGTGFTIKHIHAEIECMGRIYHAYTYSHYMLKENKNIVGYYLGMAVIYLVALAEEGISHTSTSPIYSHLHILSSFMYYLPILA